MRRFGLAVAVLAGLCLAEQSRANVKVHALFTDGAVLQRDVKCPIWGTATQDEEVITVSLNTGNAQAIGGTADVKDGHWRVDLAPLRAGGPYILDVTGKKGHVTVKNVLVGEVWVCSGQSNMGMSLHDCAGGPEAIKNSKNSMVHLFTVPNRVAAEPVADVASQWVECGPDTVGNFTGVGYYFGRDLQKALNVPVGLIHSSWGGTIGEAWTPKTALAANPNLKGLVPAEIKPGNPNQGSALYNGMIAPLLPYAVKGATWYQGESNADRAYQYRTLLPTLIQSWRDAWKNPDFGFFIVQLAPFTPINKEPVESNWAELREAQLLTAKTVKNTGLAVITDVGDEKDIHPKRKEPVGARLALAALGVTYGEKIVYSGPEYDTATFEGDKAVLSFKSVGQGLEAKDGPLTGFTIAGADKKFHNASAEIKDNKVVVTSPEVAKPLAVRFGWANYPVVNLFNKDGLPASPFRTDDFPGVTQPKSK